MEFLHDVTFIVMITCHVLLVVEAFNSSFVMIIAACVALRSNTDILLNVSHISVPMLFVRYCSKLVT